MLFCSLKNGLTPKIRLLCFVIINSVLLNLFCVWILYWTLLNSDSPTVADGVSLNSWTFPQRFMGHWSGITLLEVWRWAAVLHHFCCVSESGNNYSQLNEKKVSTELNFCPARALFFSVAVCKTVGHHSVVLWRWTLEVKGPLSVSSE